MSDADDRRAPTPDFITIGHAVQDVVPGGWELGGTVTFAAVQAHRLGRSVGIVTRTAGDLELEKRLPFARVVDAGSPVSTTFENVYHDGRREQRCTDVAAAITPDDVPPEWRAAPIVLLGPVFGEVPPVLAAAFDAASIVGVSAQGWLRDRDEGMRVRHVAWNGDPYWAGADVVFASEEDLDGPGEELGRWTRDVPTVVLTFASRGARIYADGHWRSMPAFPEQEVDATGAGDTFAAAFLIRLHESGDTGEAARFGAAAASISVAGRGVAAMPGRDEVEERMRQHPDIRLQ